MTRAKLQRNVRSLVKQSSLIRGVITDAYGTKASVKLSGNGAVYKNLDVVGGSVSKGDAVYVNMTTLPPYIVTATIKEEETPSKGTFPKPVQQSQRIATYRGAAAISGSPGDLVDHFTAGSATAWNYFYCNHGAGCTNDTLPTSPTFLSGSAVLSSLCTYRFEVKFKTRFAATRNYENDPQWKAEAALFEEDPWVDGTKTEFHSITTEDMNHPDCSGTSYALDHTYEFEGSGFDGVAKLAFLAPPLLLGDTRPAFDSEGITVDVYYVSGESIEYGKVPVYQNRTVTAGSGLSGGGSLSDDITITINTGDGIVVVDDAICADFSNDTPQPTGTSGSSGTSVKVARADHVHASTGGGHTIQDEGTPLTQRTNLNFVGDGVAVTDDEANDATIVTITAGSGGAGHDRLHDLNSTDDHNGAPLSIANGGTGTTNIADYAVPFMDMGVISSDADSLSWDNSNKRLTVKNINFNQTRDDATGIIFKANAPFLHDYIFPALGNGYNVFLGEGAGNLTTCGSGAVDPDEGSYNLGIGSAALGTIGLGYSNVGIGYATLYGNVNGDKNIAIGTNSARWDIYGNDVSELNQVIAIGFEARPSSTTATNEIIIGSDAQGAGDNTVVLGNTGITKTYLKGSLYLDDKAFIYQNGVRYIHNYDAGNNGVVTVTGKNLFIGLEAGNMTTGSAADDSGQASNNVSIGYRSQKDVDIAAGNVSVGNEALEFNQTGMGNVAIGYFAGSYYGINPMTAINGNVFIGHLASGCTSDISSAVVIGSGAEAGSSDVTIGCDASSGSGGNNIVIGRLSTISGSNSIAIGYDIDVTESNSIVIGGSSYTKTRLYGNLMLSSQARIYLDDIRFIHNFNYGYNGSVTTIGKNTFIGESAGNFTAGSSVTVNYHASHNVGVGYNVLINTTSGWSNTAVGSEALYYLTTGYSNTALGRNAIIFVTTGNRNIGIGADAALYQADGSTPLNHPESSVYIGAGCRGYNNDDSNSIVIGADAIGIGANSVVIGNTNTTKTRLFGSLGVNMDVDTSYGLSVSGLAKSVASGARAGFDSYSYGDDNNTTYPGINFFRARGTVGSPSALQSGDNIGMIQFGGRDYSGTSRARASINGYAAENWSGSATYGTYLTFNTTAPATNTYTEKMRLNGTGSLYINHTSSTFGTASSGTENKLSVAGNIRAGGDIYPIINVFGYSTNGVPIFQLTRAKGTLGSFTAPVTSDGIGSFQWAGYVSSSAQLTVAEFGAVATENWSSSAQGVDIKVYVTKTGTTGEFLHTTFANSGNLLIGTATDGMTANGSIAIAKDLAHRGTKAGFNNTTPITKPTVSGSRAGNAALASLLTALANYGLITNSTTA